MKNEHNKKATDKSEHPYTLKKADRTERKKAFLTKLEDCLGIVSIACKKSGIGRTTVYEWVEADTTFAAEMSDIKNIAIDYVESKLFENISKNDVASIIFFLKTRGKGRGYTERVEIEAGDAKPRRFNLIIKRDEP